MSRKLTTKQIEKQAASLGISVPVLRAVIEVECKGSGFNSKFNFISNLIFEEN
ncbi:hypothetical protein [Acinetobacter rudis]|uniref:hypothetical protein n=1 Tax=Acinetobacter rudis TaxID=632955 RepID=UPI0033410C67